MNEKFFHLPPERQQAILNAGFRVFAQNSYRKSPMGEIAAEAGISKALLFHYFRNKRELYLFLWDQGAKLAMGYLDAYGCYEPTDLFDMMERGMRAKFRLMARYPHLSIFAIRAFYETDPQVRGAIQESYHRFYDQKAAHALASLDPNDYVPGLDLMTMHREMYWASEGYLWEMLQRGGLDPEQMERDFQKLLEFWKHVYKRKELTP